MELSESFLKEGAAQDWALGSLGMLASLFPVTV